MDRTAFIARFRGICADHDVYPGSGVWVPVPMPSDVPIATIDVGALPRRDGETDYSFVLNSVQFARIAGSILLPTNTRLEIAEFLNANDNAGVTDVDTFVNLRVPNGPGWIVWVEA